MVVDFRIYSVYCCQPAFTVTRRPTVTFLVFLWLIKRPRYLWEEAKVGREEGHDE